MGCGTAPCPLATPRIFHFPTPTPKAYPPNRPAALQRDRMDHPAMTAFGQPGAGDDRRGRPGISSRTFAKQVRHVCAPFRRVIAGTETSAGGIKSRRVKLTFNQRRRVRAQNAATPRRSSVPCPPRRPLAGRAFGVVAAKRSDGGGAEWCVRQSWRHPALSRNSLFNGNLQGIRDFLTAKIALSAIVSRRNPPLPDQIPFALNREFNLQEQGTWKP